MPNKQRQGDADAKLQQWLKDHPDDMLVLSYAATENTRTGKNKIAIDKQQLKQSRGFVKSATMVPVAYA
jgi:hypothetical protein